MTEPWRIEAWEPLIDDDTRFLYAEMPSNPQQACFDIAAIASLAHARDIPLIVDATIATPALMRPLAHGADIVVHSLSKTAGAGGDAISFMMELENLTGDPTLDPLGRQAASTIERVLTQGSVATVVPVQGMRGEGHGPGEGVGDDDIAQVVG